MERRAYDLGPWRVRPDVNELVWADRHVHLEPKTMEVLLVFCESAGKVVSKDELLARVWPESFVSESTLFRVISELRRALGDSSRTTGFIATIPKRGYRLEVVARPVDASLEREDATGGERPAIVPAGWLNVRLTRGVWASAVVVLLIALLVNSRRGRPTLDAATQLPTEAHAAFSMGEVWEHRVNCRSFAMARRAYERVRVEARGRTEVLENLFDTVTASTVIGCVRPDESRRQLLSILGEFQGDRSRAAKRRREATFALWFGDGTREAERLFAGDLVRAIPDVNRAALLIALRRSDDAVVEARAALLRDPAALGENWTLGTALFFARQYRDAAAQFAQTLTLYEDSPLATSLFALSAIRAGQVTEAVAAARRIAWRDDPLDRFSTIPALVFAEAGLAMERDQFIARWEIRARDAAYVPPTGRAIIALSRRQMSQARTELDHAAAAGDPWSRLVAYDPTFDAIRAVF